MSLILCSRNDQYMGNSRWRLQTSLNYAAQKVHELGREEDVEVLVADWGSDVPLREVLELSPAAAGMTSFLHVPQETARPLQKDSPFAEVLALNAAARRVRGEYIGRIDQDTLVGRRFLETFFDLAEDRRQLDVPLSSALLFANQRMVPYRFSVRCPSLWAVEKYIRWFGPALRIEVTPRKPFYHHGVGIWLLHRDLWHECGGYDERMIYMNAMESDMIARLMMKYPMVNLGALVGCDFYHIEHYHPWAPRQSGTHRKENRWFASRPPAAFHPNDEEWGLAGQSLEVTPYGPSGAKADLTAHGAPLLHWPAFLLLVLYSGLQVTGDRLFLSARQVCRSAPQASGRFVRLWKHRFEVAQATVRGQPVMSWPRLLRRRWGQRGQFRRGA